MSVDQFLKNRAQRKHYDVCFRKFQKSLWPTARKISEEDLEEYQKTLDQNRSSEINPIYEETRKMLKKLCSFQLAAKSKKTSAEDFLNFQKEMTNFELNLRLIDKKIDEELSSLKNTQKSIEKEMIGDSLKIAEWEKPIDAMGKPAKNHFTLPDIHSKFQCEEIKEFKNFLKNSGGHFGGWTEQEHLVFLRARAKYRAEESTVEALTHIFPDMEIDELKAHYSWMKVYEKLRDKQRSAIKNWRLRKEEKQKPTKPEEKSKKTQLKRAEEKKTIQTAERLQHWKREKEARAKQQAELEQQMKTQKKQLEKTQKVQNDAVKEQIKDWKFAKESRARAEKIEKELQELKAREERVKQANRMIKEFRNNDELYLAKRREMASKRQQGNIFEPIHSNTAPRDPRRVLQATKQWTNRIRSRSLDTDNRALFTVKTIPKRGVPEWRKLV